MGVANFQIFMGVNNLFQFKLLGPDGKEVLVSQGFPNKDDCMALIRKIKDCAMSPERYERQADNGNLSFRLKAANHQMLAASSVYKKEEEREEAIAVVRKSSEAAIHDNAR